MEGGGVEVWEMGSTVLPPPLHPIFSRQGATHAIGQRAQANLPGPHRVGSSSSRSTCYTGAEGAEVICQQLLETLRKQREASSKEDLKFPNQKTERWALTLDPERNLLHVPHG